MSKAVASEESSAPLALSRQAKYTFSCQTLPQHVDVKQRIQSAHVGHNFPRPKPLKSDMYMKIPSKKEQHMRKQNRTAKPSAQLMLSQGEQIQSGVSKQIQIPVAMDIQLPQNHTEAGPKETRKSSLILQELDEDDA